jgi:type II restriction/modification system DNA methylase subunit YeeA
MTPHEFIAKWRPVALTERATAHSHFNDLCALLGHDDPVKADPVGEWFAFEKGVTKTGGGDGFADVWKRSYFAWEYKKRKRNLDEALAQLVRYAAALENPPLQVACDTDRFLIRTAWTNAVPKTYELALEDLSDPRKLDILHSVFFDPEKLRPTETRAGITKEAADKFSIIALRLQGRGTPEEIAHFVNQLVFCFFANSRDVKLLPDRMFPKLLKRAGERPEKAQGYFNQLFAAMEGPNGEFDLTDIAHFNGGLFDGRRALALNSGDIGLLQAAASLDWSQIDPTIFGTLFERFLDHDKRAQIGAHYTDPEKIMMIVEPVILRPLREEWEAVRTEIETILTEAAAKRPKFHSGAADRLAERAMAPFRERAEAVRRQYIERLRAVTILDPACGSGNFLYLALQGVKDIELKANLECEALGLPYRAPVVGPEIVHGIDINPLAAELARTTIWIGDIQWRRRNGIYSEGAPILRKLDSIECRDALITKKEDGSYEEAKWPEAEFIIGNPPFLGNKDMLSTLGEEQTERLRKTFEGRLPGGVDLVAYWFEKSRAMLERKGAARVGLLATQSIRRGSSRVVLDRILESNRIFEAWADEEWTIDGADVRVSIVCFARGSEERRLDGNDVSQIFADLSAGASDLATAKLLAENRQMSFQGVIKTGKFDIPGELARQWLVLPQNPNGRKNADVLKPWFNGDDVVDRWSDHWIIDFGVSCTEREAALYEAPFGFLGAEVFEKRKGKREKRASERWWLLQRSRPEMRKALTGLRRFVATPRVAKHRIFIWLRPPILPDTRLVVISRDDDCTFGVLHSRFHEAWTLRLGGWHGVGNDPQYTPTIGLATFPFPDGLTPNIPAKDYADDPRAIAIAKAAKRLDELRNAWLNPPDLIDIVPEVVAGYPDRILPKTEAAAVELKKRTLTNLYNARPQWLAAVHRDLDVAVAAAYGWPADISEEDALAKLLELNLTRAGAEAPARNDDDDDEDSRPRSARAKGPRVTRAEFAKISEVEGLRLSDEMKKDFADFDSRDLSPEERRQAIIDRFKQSAK